MPVKGKITIHTKNINYLTNIISSAVVSLKNNKYMILKYINIFFLMKYNIFLGNVKLRY